ncbi:trypsin-like serine peptidase [Lentzea kentuckyensis]|uniref:trypsin-like serine peptidase n=1 Tax=Lentzea kentuckyensis TaxID=360086 RepID=UPI000A3BA907|nr:trypsin-like peptidase domain-containing protein [Lentzea kentuckyensis]
MKRISAVLAALTLVLAPQARAEAPESVKAVVAEFGESGELISSADVALAKSLLTKGSAEVAAPTANAVVSPTVGILESRTGQCTASTISSTHKVLIVTAAHCVHDGEGGTWQQPIYFTPGFQVGRPAPHGRFQAKAAVTFDRWVTKSDYNFDVAFVALRPNDAGAAVGELVGMNGLIVNAGYVVDRTIVSYEDNVLSQCSGTTIQSMGFPLEDHLWMIGCPSPPHEGDSGSPWFAEYDGRGGYVNGVISKGSGVLPHVSTPRFDDDVLSIWEGFKDHPGT